jgi:HSP20 family molecular chaperone IbpA
MTEKELSVKKEETGIARDRSAETWLSPAVDIYEDEETLTLFADLPGVPRDRLNLGIEQGILTVEALAPAEDRRFQLPESLEFDKVSAELTDGVLKLRLPKAAAARPRKIEVTVH